MTAIRLQPIARTQLERLLDGADDALDGMHVVDGALPPRHVLERALHWLDDGVPAQWCVPFLVVAPDGAAVCGGCGFLPVIFSRRRAVICITSSSSEYATGVANSVSNNEKVWPPKITVPIALFVPDPTPLETTSGIMPATKAIVVIKIGLNRSRLARMIASCRFIPFSRN